MNKNDRQKTRAAIQRRALIRRFAIYAVMGVFVTIFTAITVLISEGYYFNPSNKQLIKNGLVFVSSKPSGATVYINGKSEKDTTESRFTLPEGKYDFSVYKEGYRDWKRSFLLGGSEVVNLNYVLLVPKTLKPKEVAKYSGKVDVVSQSPDQRWLFVHHEDAPLSAEIIDINADTPLQTKLTFAPSVFTATTDMKTFKVIQWSGDNQHILVSVIKDGAQHYIVLNRTDATKAVDITSEFGLELSDLTLRDAKFDKYYALDKDRGFRELNLTNKSISAPRFQKVITYTSADADRLLFAAEDEGTDQSSVWVADKDGKYKVQTTKKQPAADYLIEVASYDGDWYVATGSKADQMVSIFKNSYDNIKNAPSTTPRALAKIELQSPDAISFSKTSRFVTVHSGNQLVVFDNEFERTYRYDQPVSGGQGFSKVIWMDGARMQLAANGHQYLLDYDGINLQDMGEINVVSPIVFDRNYENFFGTNADATALTQTKLLVE